MDFYFFSGDIHLTIADFGLLVLGSITGTIIGRLIWK